MLNLYYRFSFLFIDITEKFKILIFYLELIYHINDCQGWLAPNIVLFNIEF